MKKLSIIIIALMLMTQGFAQEIHLDGVTPTTNTTTNSHRTSLYVYGGIGMLDWLSSFFSLAYGRGPLVTHYDVGFLLNQKVSSHWSVGLGSEFHGSQALNSFVNEWLGPVFYLDKDFHTVPVYANVRFTIVNKVARPYLELKAGYAFPLNTVYGAYRADVLNHTYTGYPEPGFQGPIRAGGFYAAFAPGCDIGRHGVSLGVTCMPIKGDFIDYSTNETLSKEGPMLNIFVRYYFAVLK